MKLALYLARRFAAAIVTVVGIFFGILVLIDLVEQVRRNAGSSASLLDSLTLSLLNAPRGLYEILPLVVLLGAVAMFLTLARTSELVVVRAVGVPVFLALTPAIIGALTVGALGVAVLNPMAVATERKSDRLSASYRQDPASTLSIGREAVWLRQGGPSGQWVIRADRASPDATRLERATFLGFDPEGQPTRRLEAESAELVPGHWELRRVKDWPLTADNPEQAATERETLDLPSNLTRAELSGGMEEPAAISFWDLRDYIQRLERAGFSARKHVVSYWVALASPLLLVAMVQIAAAFTMRHARLGQTGVRVLTAVLCGFALFFLRNFAQILGESGQIPVMLAAWGPPVVGLFFSAALILHMEDG